MFTSHIRRVAAFTAAIAVSFALHSTPAHADASSEAYVQSNASSAMNALNAAGSASERSNKFGTLMEEFADLNEIALMVLPRAQKIQLTQDAKLRHEWVGAFREYAMATYEDQLDRYRGGDLKVTGSKDSVINGKTRSRVRTEMSQNNATPLIIYWYLERRPQGWQVTDVGLGSGDSEIKLAIMQRDQFAATLQKNGGDMKKLINTLKTQTATMRDRIARKSA